MIPHWPQMQNILSLLMAMMWGQDDDGIDLFFTSSTKPYEKLMEPWQVIDPLKEKDPKLRSTAGPQRPVGPADKDPDDIYKVLWHILSMIGPGEKYPKKATILILTDGVWPRSNQQVVAEAISLWLRRMSTVVDGAAQAVLYDRYYSIQFVQLGDDPEGTRALEYLDDDLPTKYSVPDVIDVEPANGNVLKMVMGSLDDIWDEKPQSSVNNVSPKPETSSARPEPPTSPPAPLPHQYITQRTGTGSTWNTAARGTGYAEPIYEEPEMHYTAQPTRQQGYPVQRTSPPAPPGPNYAGLGLPFHPYGFQQQPQRTMTGQTSGYRLSTPPEETTPSRPQRRRDTGGGFGGTMGQH
ncbi:hypothetical protein CONLIGDRAFT_250701 [Coniochaeta ligniaria NRRL 30616]|uniref:VWFA domain-containing protein n=1 Tax=Coniochaeta ligniaria NRRL 30616 TaxID=1408157 RepID=A0A1J7IXL4_9PEZI|nr:hypothetical protein CONLIGDRAFT_250701 [Coniochaeta ligniaria NRRL 30616]